MILTAPLLIEIGTEELPPTQIRNLSTTFCNLVKQQLEDLGFTYGHMRRIATPRRLGLLLKEVPFVQPNRTIEKRGPQINAAFDGEGKPTKAALGFANSLNISIEDCQTLDTDKGAWLVYKKEEEGKPLSELIQKIIENALKELPIAKRMRWGNNDFSFVRPIHWLLTLHGDKTLPVKLFDIRSSRQTYGHRFMAPGAIMITHPDEYREKLYEAYVMISYKERRDIIEEELKKAANACMGNVIINEHLIDEVSGLLEWPVVLTAEFDKSFLSVPKEAIISVMENHQRYFPVEDSNHQLLSKFLLVTHLPARDASKIINGNQRVIRARLSDANFFYETDKKIKLIDRVDALKDVIFQQKLGSIYDKTIRIQKLSEHIATLMSLSDEKVTQAKRAALLSKADLLSNMVCEFPELQGIMGQYYAQNDGEGSDIANAIREAYLPKFSKDQLPSTDLGSILALSDRIDTMVGLFAIGQPPTGTKDPFALRRAALGILRILTESTLSLDLRKLIHLSTTTYNFPISADVQDKVYAFIMERFRAKYQDEGVVPQVVDAVMALDITIPYDFNKRVIAVNHFIKLPQAQPLAAANKRVSNLLKSSDQYTQPFNNELLILNAEKALNSALLDLEPKTRPHIQSSNYTQALSLMAELKEPLDQFFEDVMVNVDDKQLKINRILLLAKVQHLFLQVADISRLP